MDASLALAHLLEHVLVDAIAFVTSAPAISGVTGALKDSRRHFDVFVECPDPSVAPLAIELSLTWIIALAHGRPPGGGGRATLELARHLYRRRPGAVDLAVAARALARSPHDMAEAVGWLEQRNFAQRVGYTMNFSEAPPYGLKLAEASAPSRWEPGAA